MRMAEEDAQTRRDHYRRSGGATEYDALHGLGSYGHKPGAALWALIQRLLGADKPVKPVTNKTGAPHPW
ncbi:MAG: hypothetical protein QOF41_1832 [Methylobacteriaceae bacterium]|jgi:hypothetical protein|nr:hypothetical protein [Methylobacteriaceae bacterium]